MDVEEVLKIFAEEFRKVYNSSRIVSSFDVKQAIIVTNSNISVTITKIFNNMSIEKQEQLEQEKIRRMEFTQRMFETMKINPRKRPHPDEDDPDISHKHSKK